MHAHILLYYTNTHTHARTPTHTHTHTHTRDLPVEILAEALEAVDVENACRALNVHVREEGAPLSREPRVHRRVQTRPVEGFCSAARARTHSQLIARTA